MTSSGEGVGPAARWQKPTAAMGLVGWALGGRGQEGESQKPWEAREPALQG